MRLPSILAEICTGRGPGLTLPVNEAAAISSRVTRPASGWPIHPTPAEETAEPNGEPSSGRCATTCGGDGRSLATSVAMSVGSDRLHATSTRQMVAAALQRRGLMIVAPSSHVEWKDVQRYRLSP